MKFKDYLKELSLVILGVLIALLIENYREHIRDKSTVRSYLSIVEEDLNFDVINLVDQLKKRFGLRQKVEATKRCTHHQCRPYQSAIWPFQMDKTG